MNIVLTTLNAKYTHHNLALRYLDAYCRDRFPQIKVKEFNINQRLALILGELASLKPDVIGFSCYIWNIEPTLELISNLKKIGNDMLVVLGGPEVSFEYDKLMEENLGIDFIISGEGEQPFYQLLALLAESNKPTWKQLAQVPSLVYRAHGKIIANPRITMDLAQIPGAYQRNLDGLVNKIVYYETSRGCPFNCQYCLSSRTGQVRYFPLDRCIRELGQLAKLGIEQIRFVDRTFNCDPNRFYEMLKFMISLDTSTRFQLEICGDLLNDDVLQLLEKAPPNRLQFEIGVQSTNPRSLKQVNRVTNFEKLSTNVTKLRERTNVRFLLDLISGLPDETLQSFGYAFDYVYHLHPTKIQLGFLKLLKGSQLRARVDQFNCLFTDKAPYEVLKTDSISYLELSLLKTIAALVELYYNSGRFTCSLDYLLSVTDQRPFTFFADLAVIWKSKGYHMVSHSVFNLYKMLWDLVGNKDPVLKNYLHFDYRYNESKRTTPQWLLSSDQQNLAGQLIHSGKIYRYLPKLKQLKLSSRELRRQLMVEVFDYQIYPRQFHPIEKKQVLIFDYSSFPEVNVCTVDD